MTQKNINLFTTKIVKNLPTNNNLFLVVIIQSYKKNLINRHQIYKLAKKKSQNIYIFLTSYTKSKTKDVNLVISKKLLKR